MDGKPALLQMFELSLRLFWRTSMKPETLAVFANPLALHLEIIGINMRQGFFDFFQRIGDGDQFPGAFTLQEAFRQALLAGGGEQAAVQIPELGFPVIVGARQPGDIVAVKQAWGVTVGSFLDDMEEALQLGIGLALNLDLVQIIRQGLFDLSPRAEGFVLRVKQSRNFFQPMRRLMQNSIVRLESVQGLSITHIFS